MTKTTYQAETGITFVLPQVGVGVLGLSVPASPLPNSGRHVAGLDWRHTGEVCPQATTEGRISTSVPSITAGMADVRLIAAFDNKHSVPGLSAWSPPV